MVVEIVNKTIAIINNKGGVGKTTCTAYLASTLANRNYKVLLIDTDPQGNLSRLFGFEPKDNREKTLSLCLDDILKNNSLDPIKYIESSEIPNIDILVGDINLTANRIEIERALTKFNFVYKKIIDEIKKLEKYDFILFDTCPSLGAENSQILVAVEYLIIPSTSGRNSVEGIDQLIDFYNNCRCVNPNLKLLGILFNNVNMNSMIGKDVLPMVKESYGEYIFDTVISRSVIAEKLEWSGMSLDKNNKIYASFFNASEEVLNRIG